MLNKGIKYHSENTKPKLEGALMQPYMIFFISRRAEKITISKSPLEASNIISMVYRIMRKKNHQKATNIHH
jgi:hypothetical protein